MQQELRALIERHCHTLGDELAALAAELSRLDDPRCDNAEVIAEVIAHAHKIKGSSGSIGFASVSAAAALLENHLRGMATLGSASAAQDGAAVWQHLDTLARLVAAIRPEDSSLFNVTFPPARSGRAGGGH